jgi:hypothetical protein
MLPVNSALSPRPVLDGSVEHEGAVGLQDLEGAAPGVVCLPRELLEVRESKPWPEMALLAEIRDMLCRGM